MTSQVTTIAIPLSESPSKIPKGVSLGLIVAIGTTAIVALHAISLIAQIVVTPIIFGIGIGVAIHIVLKGPKESIECAKPVIVNLPDTAKVVINQAPAMIVKMGEAIDNMLKVTLQSIGGTLRSPSEAPYTFSEVAQSLATESHKRARDIFTNGMHYLEARPAEQTPSAHTKVSI